MAKKPATAFVKPARLPTTSSATPISPETAVAVKKFKDKLASSGITEQMATDAQLRLLLEKQVNNMGMWKDWGGFHALCIPYIDPWSGEPMRRTAVDMHRLRCLGHPDPLPRDFPKYLQPSKTGAVGYFPPLPSIDWPKILADTSEDLIITEGELKSILACALGFLTIGIGGVWNFRRGDQLLPELLKITWTGRRVYITFDSDARDKPQVREARRILTNLLIEQGAKVFIVALPDVVEDGKTGLDDFLVHHGNNGPVMLRDLLAVAEEAELIPDLPTIDVAAGKLDVAATAAEDAMITAEAPIYQRGNALVRPYHAEVRLKDDSAVYEGAFNQMNQASISDVLCGVAEFQRYDGRMKRTVTIDPPMPVIGVLLSRLGRWRVPPVVGVITSPTLRPDGSVITEGGYDPATRLYHMADPNLRMPDMPEAPTKADADLAMSLLTALLAEFPFETPADRAVALSGILTAAARGMFDVVPGHVFSASTPGTGKSYLIDVIVTIATGQRAPSMGGENPEEMVKHLTAKLISGAPIISIDNVNGELGGDLLCQLIERPVVTVRPLGQSVDVKVETRVTFFANGNGIAVRGDLVRRCLKCTLDAGVERPELREFKDKPLERVMDDRGKYLAAAMTVVRAYIAAGRPDIVAPPLGSFERWSDVIRSALVWIGYEDPVASIDSARDDDPDLELHRQLFGNVPDHLMNVGVTSKLLVTTAKERLPDDGDEKGDLLWPEFSAAVRQIAGNRGDIDTKKLGDWLLVRRNKVVDGRRLVRIKADKNPDKKHHDPAKWMFKDDKYVTKPVKQAWVRIDASGTKRPAKGPGRPKKY